MKHQRTAVLTLTLLFLQTLIPSAIQPAERKAKRIAPIGRPPGYEQRKKEADAEREAVESGRLVPLEKELIPAPIPRASVISNEFDGMDFNDTPGYVPPDTHAATGPDHIVETVNTSFAIYNRVTGAIVSGPTDLSVFFSSLSASENLTDPVVAYDELAQRFFIGVLDFGPSNNSSRLLYAVSNTFDPTAGFAEKRSINLAETGAACGTVLADFTRVGWNADAHVFTFNMFNFDNPEPCFDHVSVITIKKSTVLDLPDTIPFSFTHADRSGFSNFTLTPSVMHGSSPGDPMWFVEVVFFNEVRIVKMTNILSGTPAFSAPTDITVTAFGSPPSASQGGGGRFIDTNDSRILNAEWRDDRLVATHTVGISGTARARWYEFNTSGSSPTLTQQGTINPGLGIHTYYPSIAVSEGGAIGMTFMQSSSAEFMSMYVTARLLGDAAGTMRTPLLAKAGEANYTAFDCTFGDICRAGDYSGITVDPDLSSVFCAVNEYATNDSSENWGTHIACFSLGTHDLAVTKLTAPKTATNGATLPVKVTIQNRSDHNERIPDASYLGDGINTGLVRLNVEVVDLSGENCAAADWQLNTAKNAALFTKGPKILKPKGSVTINFLVTYHCSNARSPDKTDPNRGDYTHTATVYHEAIDVGAIDDHSDDDICPHDPLFDSNPLPSGMTDKGCGAKKLDGTLGADVVTDVIL